MPDMTTQSANTGAEVQPRPRVLLCGDPRTAEFQVALRDVSAMVPPETISQVTCLAELREWLADREPPDLLVLVQTWSDEFCFTDILALPGFGPFSRLICCYGPWCVSDGRNRQDFPLAVRVPFEHFRPALLDEWRQLTEPGEMHSPLPWTAGRDEIFSHKPVGRVSRPVRVTSRDSGSPSHCTSQREIRVHSADLELSRLWLEALQAAGFAATGTDHQDGQIVLWDIDVWSDSIIEDWRILRQRCPGTQVVALTGFATPDLVDRVRDAGAALVLSKLLPLDSFWVEIAGL